MSDYPLIDPADVRAGDVVRQTYRTYEGNHLAVIEGEVYLSAEGSMAIGGRLIEYSRATDLRLVHRPAPSPPPEPALRVGDWVRDRDGIDRQIVNERGLTNCHGLTRIEPPVGWPVAVPDPDAPGGVRWWVRDPGGEYRGWHDGSVGYLEWADLVAAGGVPALAPEPTP